MGDREESRREEKGGKGSGIWTKSVQNLVKLMVSVKLTSK